MGGSVIGEPATADPTHVEIARLQLERDELRRELDQSNSSLDNARAEVDIMRPVVDAAVAWSRDEDGSPRDDLRAAVDAYRNATEPF
jgi:hypothetical protein